MKRPPLPTREQLWRWSCLCRLHRPVDLVLLLVWGLAASLLAAQGAPAWGPLLALLWGALLVRCAAWLLNDWLESRLSAHAAESFIAQGWVSEAQARALFAALLLLALLLILPLGRPLLYLAAAVPFLLLALVWIRTRLYLTQLWLGICFAWLVPLAYTAQGVWPDKGGWLLFTALALWATALTTLYAIPRGAYELRLGIRSLAQLLGDHIWLFILLMQTAAMFALWLAGRQLELGLFYTLGLLVALLLLPWQFWLLLASPADGAMRSYYSQLWSAIAILGGVLIHVLRTA